MMGRQYAIIAAMAGVFEGRASASVMCAVVADPGGQPVQEASIEATNLSTAKVYSVRSERNGKVNPASPASHTSAVMDKQVPDLSQ